MDGNEFSSPSIPSIDISSTWQKPKLKQEIFTQTTLAQKYIESETQTFASIHQHVQTDLDPTEGRKNSIMKLDFKQEKSLIAFLDRAERDLSRQLLKNLTFRAYDGYEVKWEDEFNSNTKLYELQDLNIEEGSIVTCLSWSASGSTIAAGFGRRDHAAWCMHAGRISTWSLSGRKVSPDKPTFCAQVSTCLMSLSYHPEQNTVIGGGTYNGQLIIWDTNKNENPVIASSKDGEIAHHEAITSITWIPSSSRRHTYDILTTSTDGKIFMYSFSNDLSRPITGSRIILPNVASVVRSPLNSKVAKINLPVGCTAASLPQAVGNSIDHLIIGTETGFVLKCVISGVRIEDISQKIEDLINPVTFGFKSHTGPIYSVACSLFHRNLFLTCADDREVRLYSTLEPHPLLTFEPSSMNLTCAAWSPTRPAVYAVGCADGNVYFYDLKKSITSPSDVISINTSSNSRPPYTNRKITAVAFPRRVSKSGLQITTDLIAASDDIAHIHVYKLSTDLSREVIGEIVTLDSISNQSNKV